VVAVFKISSKYVGITRSLATRRTLGIPKLLKCIIKAQPEPGYEKKTAAEPEPFHFYKSSTTMAPMPMPQTPSTGHVDNIFIVKSHKLKRYCF